MLFFNVCNGNKEAFCLRRIASKKNANIRGIGAPVIMELSGCKIFLTRNH